MSFTAYFEYKKSTDSEWQQTTGDAVTETDYFEKLVAGLEDGEDYDFRIVTDEDGTILRGETLTFTSWEIASPAEANAIAVLAQITAEIALSGSSFGYGSIAHISHGYRR